MTQLSHYKEIIETVPDGIVVIDSNGIIELFNDSAERMFGFSRAEAIGKSISILVSQSKSSEHDKYIENYFKTGKASVIGKTNEVLARKKNGEEFLIDLSIGEIDKENGSRFVGIFRDITDRKQIESILRHAKQEADRNNKAKSEFVSSITHELHTPLNAILGFANLLEHDSSLSTIPKNNARKIYRSGKYLLNIVNNVMELVKLEGGQLEVSLQSVNLNEVLQKAVSELKEEALEQKIKIILSQDENTNYLVKADKKYLPQVIKNILTNAVKYNKRNGTVTISFKITDEGSLYLTVEDTGYGIADDKKQDLFTAFDRLGYERGAIQGVGIGLVVANRLITLMGGSIDVESQLGKGSRFSLVFPDFKTLKAKEKIKERLLVVEDNPTNRELFKQQLGYLGYPVIVAEDGLNAISILNSEKVDMVLTDINMPNMDGYDLARTIRDGKTRASSKIPIVAVTANISDGEVRKGNEIGIDIFLPKPIDLIELEQMLVNYFTNTSVEFTAIDEPPGELIRSESEHFIAGMLVSTVGPDVDKHITLLDSYCATSKEMIDDILQAFSRHDAKLLSSTSHKIKSSSRAVGALILADICQTLEIAGREDNWQVLVETIDSLETEFVEVEACIRKYINRFSGTEAISKELRVLIIDDDRFSIDLIKNLLEQQGISNIISAMSGEEALEVMRISTDFIDLVFCDLNMPTMDGIEIIRHLAEEHYPGGITLISGEDQRLLKSAENLAKARELNLLGAIEKPLTNISLDTILDAYQQRRIPAEKAGHSPAVSLERLQKAINSKKICTYFQPKVDMKTRQVVGVEALARWKHSDHSIISPDSFISMAEENDLIDEITEQVFLCAFMQMEKWLKQGFSFNLSLNISVNTLVKLDLPEIIVDYANRFSIPTKKLVLEITESRLMADITSALDILTRMSLKGIKLSIDDFGTGYSSMEQLQRAPFSELKIDRSFVTNASEDKALRAILESSIDLAKKLDMVIVAEGVESQDDWNLVASLGADQAQGFYVAEPLAAGEFESWLHDWQKGEGS